MAEQAAETEGQTVRDQAKERAKALVNTPELEKKPDAKPTEAPANELDEDLKKQPEKKPEPTPGTPDKVIQQLQQNQADINRKLTALLDKKESGEELTAEDRATIAKAENRQKAIKEKLAQFGEIDDISKDLAEEVLDMREGIEAVSEQAAKGDEVQKDVKELRAEIAWLKAENKYPSTDVRKVWGRAVTDAEVKAKEELGSIWEDLTDQQRFAAIDGKANTLFNERCDAVEKRAASLNTKQPTVPATTNYASTKVTTTATTTPAGETNPVEAQLIRARRLVLTNN